MKKPMVKGGRRAWLGCVSLLCCLVPLGARADLRTNLQLVSPASSGELQRALRVVGRTLDAAARQGMPPSAGRHPAGVAPARLHPRLGDWQPPSRLERPSALRPSEAALRLPLARTLEVGDGTHDAASALKELRARLKRVTRAAQRDQQEPRELAMLAPDLRWQGYTALLEHVSRVQSLTARWSNDALRAILSNLFETARMASGAPFGLLAADATAVLKSFLKAFCTPDWGEHDLSERRWIASLVRQDLAASRRGVSDSPPRLVVAAEARLLLPRTEGETAWWGFATVPSDSGDDVVAIDHGRPVLAEPRVVRVWTQGGDEKGSVLGADIMPQPRALGWGEFCDGRFPAAHSVRGTDADFSLGGCQVTVWRGVTRPSLSSDQPMAARLD